MEIFLSMPLASGRALEFIEKNMAVTIALSSFKGFVILRRSLRLIWGGCKFPNFLHSIGLRRVKEFLINILFSKDYPNSFQTRVLTNLTHGLVFLDPSREIAETPILWWRWFKSLQRLGLRGVSCHARRLDLYCMKEMGHFEAQNSCSVWVLQTNTLPIGLNRISWKRNVCHVDAVLRRSPTDWVKSD